MGLGVQNQDIFNMVNFWGCPHLSIPHFLSQLENCIIIKEEMRNYALVWHELLMNKKRI